MIERKKLLIATTNEGKYAEIVHFLGDLPFELVSLKDVGAGIPEPDEAGNTIEENAILKARYYGEKTGFLTIADDGGLFLDALNGWPGVKSARIADNDEARRRVLLQKMEYLLSDEDRKAHFKTSLAIFDPDSTNIFIVDAELEGRILKEALLEGDISWGYNTIFYIPSIDKTYGQLTIADKNAVSHRGKALAKAKYFLQNQYRGKHFVVPVGLLIKDGKLLMSLRNDPHRTEFHKKWEFPGGSVELGEQIEENLMREMKEETGYEVEIVRLLQGIFVKYRPEYEYQIYLLPYVCKIVGGDGQHNDAEILDMKFLPLDEWLTMDLIGENLVMYEKLLPELKEVVSKFTL